MKVKATRDGGGSCIRYKLTDSNGRWCEVTVYEGERFVGSYGGQWWPYEHPELFKARPPSIYGSGYDLTDEGFALLSSTRPEGSV